MNGPAGAYWAESLGRWAIPQEILSSAPESPFGCPAACFVAGDDPVETPSRSRALEALPEGGTVLDVGAGGGAAGLGLVPPAARLVAVDQSQEMLDSLRASAQKRPGLAVETFMGRWPDAAGSVPVADVVVCHNVLYNVADLPSFLAALDSHARNRVVIQITQRHPRSMLSAMWKHFWGSELPDAPIADDAAAVVAEEGYEVHMELFDAPATRRADRETQVRFIRRQLCLGPDADAEIDSLLGADGFGPRPAACLWWDVLGQRG